MAKVISFINHKGGCAKSTSVLAVATAMAKYHGKKVLVIDADPQANTSITCMGEDITRYPRELFFGSMLNALIQDEPYKTKPVDWEGIQILPTSMDMAVTEVNMQSITGREYIFEEMIQRISREYDYILFDCPPSLGIITQNALVASNYILIPTDGSYFALMGIENIHKVVAIIKKKLKVDVEIAGYFMTRFDERKKLDRAVRDSLSESMKEKMFKTVIRNNVALGEAQYQNLSVFSYAPESNGARDYIELTKEIMKRINK